MSALDTTPNTEHDGPSLPLAARFYPEEIARIKRCAVLDQRTRASLIRLLVMRALVEHEKMLESATA